MRGQKCQKTGENCRLPSARPVNGRQNPGVGSTGREPVAGVGVAAGVGQVGCPAGPGDLRGISVVGLDRAQIVFAHFLHQGGSAQLEQPGGPRHHAIGFVQGALYQ